MKKAIFYGSKGGVCEGFAKQIAEKIGAEVFNIKDCQISKIAEYDFIIFAASSYYFGALQEDWGNKVKLLHEIDFSNKTIALLGVGSQARHADSFCSGIADFYDKLRFSGARFVGEVDSKDYNFSFSRAQKGQKLLGLCLDKADEDKNNARIESWVKSLA
ncbi:MAG: flavodoxin domain-containing protein [Helicobacteraceae bacterium]|nr:flavodoxin domain-containing protein [Helicobacteraceae bacterium]